MSRKLHEKWASVQFIADKNKTDVLTHKAINLPPYSMDARTFVDPRAGAVIMYEVDGQIIEVVLGTRVDDVIGAMYKPNPIFNSPADLRQARIDLIEMIEDIKNSEPGYLEGKCRARNRKVDLKEMPTVQLIDILAEFVKKQG
jgi:hypothetical protein